MQPVFEILEQLPYLFLFSFYRKLLTSRYSMQRGLKMVIDQYYLLEL